MLFRGIFGNIRIFGYNVNEIWKLISKDMKEKKIYIPTGYEPYNDTNDTAYDTYNYE